MATHARKARDLVFLTLCIMGFFAILSSTMSKSPVLPEFADYLQTPPGFWTGLTFVASTIPGILISLPAGSLSDILGRRKVLLISSAIFASAPFTYLLINVWWQLILVRFYHGFATGMFVPVAQASIAENFPTKRGERISLFSSVTSVGRSIAPLLGGSILFITNPGLLPEHYSNFHGLYLSVGVAGLTAFITALPFLRGRKEAESEKKQKTDLKNVLHKWKIVAGTHGVLVVSLIEAGQYYTYGSVESYLVKYMIEVAALNSFLQGIVLAAELSVVVLSKPLIGRLSDRIGRRTPIILGCLISVVPLAVIPFFKEFSVLLVLAVIYGFGFSMVTSVTPALVSDLVSINDVGSAMGVISTLMDVGQTLGPLICGMILVTSLGYVGLFFSLAIVLVSTVAIFGASKIDKAK
jgi:MFS family permease